MSRLLMTRSRGRRSDLERQSRHPRGEHGGGERRDPRCPVPGRQRDQREARPRAGRTARRWAAGASRRRSSSSSTAGSRSSCSIAVPSPTRSPSRRDVRAALRLAAGSHALRYTIRSAPAWRSSLRQPKHGRSVVYSARRRASAEPRGLQERVLLGVHADADVVGRAARVLVAVGAAVTPCSSRYSAGSRAACRCSRWRRCDPRARVPRRRGARGTRRAGAWPRR